MQHLLIRSARCLGSPVIDTSSNIRCIFGVSPIDVTLYLNPLSSIVSLVIQNSQNSIKKFPKVLKFFELIE